MSGTVVHLKKIITKAGVYRGQGFLNGTLTHTPAQPLPLTPRGYKTPAFP